MAIGFSNTNKPINPRGNDASPKGFNRAKLYSGKALSFDGVNDDVNCGDVSDLDFGTGNFSVSLYVKINSAQSSLQNIFSKKDAAAATAGYSIFYNHSTGKLLFSNANGTSASEIFSADSFTQYEDQWIHLVAVRDSSDDKNAYFYINAVKHELASTLTIYDTDNSYDFKIGNTHTGAYFNNQQVAGLKVFNTALTAAQVADLYKNPEKVVPTGVDNTALKLWLPMQEGAGTTAYDGSPVGFTEDIVTGFTNGTTYPLDSFASSGDDITTAIKTNGFGGCVSNGHYYTNGQKVKVKFTYQKNSGNDLRVLFSNVVTGAGTSKSDTQNVSASGEFEHTFTMTADGIAYLQLGTGNASHSIDAVITDVYVSPNVSANHGTISGATYTHGIGAPVSQTAVISWNKGTNLFEKSEQFGVSPWSSARVTIANNIITAPDGRVTSGRALETSSNGFRDAFISNDTFASGVPITLSCFVKGGLGRDAIYLYTNDGSGSGRAAKFNINTGAYIGNASGSGFSAWDSYTTKDYGNGWFKFSATLNSSLGTSKVYNLGISDNTNDALAGYDGNIAKGIYFWGASLEQSATAGPYVRTGATAQTTPVLLPAGLTTGRDITGVNLFENVRKQGALNLDGNSWAEVHDNASLDVTTGLTLEAWVYWDGTASDDGIIGRWGGGNTYLLQAYDADDIRFYIHYGAASFVETGTALAANNWYHVVGTYDNTNQKIYINGSESASISRTGNISVSAFDIQIGRYGGAVSTQYDNSIAQPRIYNRALTAAEVLQNYNSGKNTYK